jgi:tRNA-dihydrouridine synthase A
MSQHFNRKFCVAPMMDLTDRHFRYMFRQIVPKSLLYTEMLTSPAVVNGDRDYLLTYNPEEHPIALQIGGSDVKQVCEASRIGEQFGYDEINLNCGCPSDRVQSGKIGACLMAEPELVAECLSNMQEAVTIPVTVKCRIGIDKNDEYDELHRFINTLYQAGCRVFIVHARKAWLQGLSPRENRTVPPLRYDVVYRLKKDFPSCEIIINGGIKRADEVADHLQRVDGVMLGREAYYNPYAMFSIAREVYGYQGCGVSDREELVEIYLDYMQRKSHEGVPVSRMIRHLVALYQAVPGARAWRRCLSEGSRQTACVETLVRKAQGFLVSDTEQAGSL